MGVIITSHKYICSCGETDHFGLKIDPEQKKLVAECMKCRGYFVFLLAQVPEGLEVTKQ